MEGLPFLPGNNFTDPTVKRRKAAGTEREKSCQNEFMNHLSSLRFRFLYRSRSIPWSNAQFLFQKSKYHRSQTLGYRNGYRIPNRPSVGIGGEPVPYDGLSEQELDELANFQPTLTYGQAKQAPPSDFVPAHVFWDKKVGPTGTEIEFPLARPADFPEKEPKLIRVKETMPLCMCKTGSRERELPHSSKLFPFPPRTSTQDCGRDSAKNIALVGVEVLRVVQADSSRIPRWTLPSTTRHLFLLFRRRQHSCSWATRRKLWIATRYSLCPNGFLFWLGFHFFFCDWLLLVKMQELLTQICFSTVWIWHATW